jgi:hypothetical protein
VNDRQRQKQLERRIEADSLLPPLHQNDSAEINFRRLLLEREELGFKRLSARALEAIRTQGYDAYFIDQMNSYSKIGLGQFHKLAAMGRLEITTEQVIFQHYRDRLKPDCRRRIAILLLGKTRTA